MSLTQDINRLQRRIWTLEKVVCGPGPERDALCSELKQLYEEKAELVAQRSAEIRQQNADNIACEFGGGVLTNDSRTIEQRRMDINAANQRKRENLQREVAAFGDLLKPRQFSN